MLESANASTDSRIHCHPVNRLTFSGSAARVSNAASTAAFLAAIVPYTLPSIASRRYSKTRSAGFNSGEYGGCSIRWRRRGWYRGPRWPRARSQTRNWTRRWLHFVTTGPMDSAFILSVQAHIIFPLNPLTAKLRYAHSRLYSTSGTTFTPRGAHTRRRHPINPTRISSPQKSRWPSTQPRACNWTVNPLFSRPLDRPGTLWGNAVEALSSLSLNAQRPGASPSTYRPHHNGSVPIRPHPRCCAPDPLQPASSVGFLRPHLTKTDDPHALHIGGLKPRSGPRLDTRQSIVESSGNGCPLKELPLSYYVPNELTKAHEGEPGAVNLFPPYTELRVGPPRHARLSIWNEP